MNKVKNKNNFARFFIIFLTSFLLWMIFAFNYGQNLNKELLKKVETAEMLWILEDKELDLTKFWEVYNLIKLNNYDSNWINKEELLDSAIKWLVDWLWDKHSEFMTINEKRRAVGLSPLNEEKYNIILRLKHFLINIHIMLLITGIIMISIF